ncbi:hypothetical protein K474DRAFT_1676122 [Panus rudis PR-1116 ss-1]|nr:hypothetical protein K474DRAFT_1676122 [Panus rudis PR-1116 ss-1]
MAIAEIVPLEAYKIRLHVLVTLTSTNPSPSPSNPAWLTIWIAVAVRTVCSSSSETALIGHSDALSLLGQLARGPQRHVSELDIVQLMQTQGRMVDACARNVVERLLQREQHRGRLVSMDRSAHTAYTLRVGRRYKVTPQGVRWYKALPVWQPAPAVENVAADVNELLRLRFMPNGRNSAKYKAFMKILLDRPASSAVRKVALIVMSGDIVHAKNHQLMRMLTEYQAKAQAGINIQIFADRPTQLKTGPQCLPI